MGVWVGGVWVKGGGGAWVGGEWVKGGGCVGRG